MNQTSESKAEAEPFNVIDGVAFGVNPGLQIDKQVDLAEILGTCPKNITRWKKAGMPVNDSARAIAWLFDRKLSELTGGEGRLSLQQERARLASEQADKIAMENESRRGELIEVKEIEEAWTKIVMAIRSGVLAMGSRLAPELIGMKTERQIKKRIDDETHIVLSDLSNDLS